MTKIIFIKELFVLFLEIIQLLISYGYYNKVLQIIFKHVFKRVKGQNGHIDRVMFQCPFKKDSN